MIFWLGAPTLFFYALAVILWRRTPPCIPLDHPHYSLRHPAKCLFHPDYFGKWRLLFRSLAVGSATLGNAFLLALCLNGC